MGGRRKRGHHEGDDTESLLSLINYNGKLIPAMYFTKLSVVRRYCDTMSCMVTDIVISTGETVYTSACNDMAIEEFNRIAEELGDIGVNIINLDDEY